MTDEPSVETRKRIESRLSLINKALQSSSALQSILGVPLIALDEGKGEADGGKYVEFSVPFYPLKALRDAKPQFRDFLEYHLGTMADFQAAQDAASSLIDFMIPDEGKLTKRAWDKKPSWWRE
mgnify:CR=1 FL=1